MTTDVENFRVRVAREKRERMRSRLLSATMTRYAEQRGAGPTLIDDVIKIAGVSRGTFYKYFASVEEVLAELGSQLVEDTIADMRVMFAGVDDPLQRTASGIQLMMLHAIVDPVWGGFVVHSPHLVSSSAIWREIEESSVKAARNGDFRFRVLQAAIDYQIAITFDAVERLLSPIEDRACYMYDMTRMTLVGLGVEFDRASEIIRVSQEEIRKRAPTALPWWRDLEMSS